MPPLSAALVVAAEPHDDDHGASDDVGGDDWNEHSPMVVSASIHNDRQQNSNTTCSACRRSSSMILASLAVILTVLAAIFNGSRRSYLHYHRASQPATMDAEEPYTQHSRRSFVCISGQLERLELQNKIATVLYPLREAGYEPDIALVLDDSSLRVTNGVGPKGVDFAYSPVYKTFADAVEVLRDLDFRVLTESPYIQVAEPIVNEQYVLHLQQKAGMTYEQHRDRSKNNIRMMESWQQCYAEMMADDTRSMRYDIIVRVREDAGFLEALDISFLRQELDKGPKTVISNGCRTSHGMNDKAAIVSRPAARSYFLSPLQYYYTKPIHDDVVSSESFIFYTYLEEGLLLLQPPEIRSVVKLATDEKGGTFLFPGEKKTLIHMCRVRVDHDDAPSNCKVTRDIENRVCWAYSMKDSACNTCK